MNILKTFFAIFASVLLVGTQTVLAQGAQEFSNSKACRCCACKKLSCCVAQPTAPSQPVPAAPARATSQNHFQIVSTIAVLLLQSPEKSAEKISFVPSASPNLTDAPLYQRNCSYLL